MKKSLLFFFAVLTCIFAHSQNLTQQWATSFAGTGDNSDKLNAVITDGAGNFYAGGYMMNAGNGKDFLLIKYNASGDTVWTRTYDGTGNGNDEISSLCFDNSGHIVVGGTTKTLNGKDLTLAEYNANGDSLWLQSFDYTAHLDDYGVAVVADASGNVFIAGYGYNTNLNNDYIVVKYSSAGAQQATAFFNGANSLDDVLADMAIDASGNVVVTGKSKTTSNKDDYATIKYNSSMVAQWTITLDQAGKTDRATGVYIDGAGDVYVTGRSNNGSDDDYLTMKYLAANGANGWSTYKIFDSNGDDQAADIAGNANEVVVTGTKNNGFQTDIQTVAYALSNGAQLWSTAYANANGKNESANHITVNASDVTIVTGTVNVSTSVTTNNDMLILKYNGTGAEQFVKIIGGNSNVDDNGSASLLDVSGNVYTVGALVNSAGMKDAALVEHDNAGTLQFNKSYNGLGEFTEKGVGLCMSSGVLYSTGYTYVYGEDRNFCTIKYDAAGNKVWTKTLNGPNSDTDEPIGIAPDGSGNIYVVGRSKNAANNYDIFIIKYNPAGDTIWTRNYDAGLTTDETASDLAVDASGNIYVTGVADNDASLLTNNDFITLKYSAAGTLQWVKVFNGTSNADDKAASIALDNAGNAFVSGKTWNGTDYDIQVMQYASANGAAISFATYVSNLGDDVPVKIKVDNNNNVIVAAKSDRDGTGATNIDILTIQYNSAGTQQWLQLYNGSGNGDDDVNNMTLDALGNIYLAGSVDVDATSAVNEDFVTIKYSTTGNKDWDKTFNGTANSVDVAYDVSVDASGVVYVTGQTDNGTLGDRNLDGTTVEYSAAGVELSHISFNGFSTSSDGNNAVLNDNGSIYVTGWGTFDVPNQKDFLTIKYNLVSGINDLQSEMTVSVYPNPSSDVFTVSSSQFTQNTKNELKVYDVLGKEIYSAVPQSSIFNLQSSIWQPGIYFLRVVNGNHIFESKLIVQ